MSGKNTKSTAALSLGVMAAGFAATLPWSGEPWVRFLQNGFEAGLVGGLADWFAVTALFRHPLGIPIPHTALLPKNRERVTQALVSSVEQDLLSKESLKNKLAGMHIVPLLLDATERQLGSEQAKLTIVGLADYAIAAVPWDKAAVLLEKELLKQLDAADVRKALTVLIDAVLERGMEEKAFDYALDVAERWVLRESTVQTMGAMASRAIGELQTSGFMSFALNAFAGFMTEDRLGSMIQRFILSSLESLRMPLEHNRMSLLREVRRQLQSLPDRPDVEEQAMEWLRSLGGRYDLAAIIAGFLDRLRGRLTEAVHAEGFAEHTAIPLLRELLQKARSQEGFTERAEAFVQDQAAQLIETHHHKIGTLIRENVDKFDNETLIEMLEDKIGADLQWIRVNGAVCGFLIGIILAGIKLLAP
ncbi:DUF445 domain-containing protein [Paenibacillus filicis]|uniref:DUF445 domain-containing protein n=1 Tax=Paenibacillus gyeongsangnamensis TaxID=3388067 RepID=A0ABT4QFE9_9BACL|nr:DUF445 domain-containing protein [Paenibacillus filicis]MCZ8515585.1 DUF445 domain-containing protein [Paenibacillus filicis]